MKLIIRQYVTNVKVVPQSSGGNKLIVSNTQEIVKLIIRTGGGDSGGDQNLQEVTDNGNTTTNDIEITDENSGLILTLGARRARITLSDDGFGNLQLTITELF